MNKKGAGIFVTVNETDLKGRKKANIKRVRAVFQEDDGEGKELPVNPHITVNTSPGHYHRYILTDSVSFFEFGQIMETMVSGFGSDPNAKDICRVMRLPGFLHSKDPKNLFQVRIVDQSNELPFSGDEVKRLFLPEKKDTFEEICEKLGSVKLTKLINQIVTGTTFHGPLRDLSAHYIGSGNSQRSTVSTLQALMEQAPIKDARWQTRFKQITDLVKSAIKKYGADSVLPENLSPINVISCADLLTKQFPPRKNLLNPWLPEQGLCMVHAYRGVGKTHLSVGIACAVSTGASFLTWKAKTPAGVLFIDGEMPAVVLQERMAQSIAMMDGTGEAPFNIITPDLQGDHGMPDLASMEGQARIEPYLNNEIKLIILDNISTLCRSGQENKGDSWVPVQEWALKMRARGKSVLLIHHEGKGGQQRGTSRREDILDTVIQLKHSADYSPDLGATFEVHFKKSRGVFGDDVKPFEAQLIDMGVGNSKWTTRSLEDSILVKVERLLADGYQQKEVAEELNISKGYVSKLVRKIKAKG